MFVGDEFAEEYAPIFCSTCAGFAVSEDEANGEVRAGDRRPRLGDAPLHGDAFAARRERFRDLESDGGHGPAGFVAFGKLVVFGLVADGLQNRRLKVPRVPEGGKQIQSVVLKTTQIMRGMNRSARCSAN
jgi:hypothetical protein